MANLKISELPAATSLSVDDLFVVVDDPAGVAVTKKITVANARAALAAQAMRTTVPTGSFAHSFERYEPGVNTLAFLTSGFQSFVAVWLNAGETVSNISWISGTQAAVTPTNQWSSLYDINRNKLGVSADLAAAAWAASTLKAFALTAPYVVLTSGLYYVGLTVVAATVPTLQGLAPIVNVAQVPPILAGRDAVNAVVAPASAPLLANALTALAAVPYVSLG